MKALTYFLLGNLLGACGTVPIAEPRFPDANLGRVSVLLTPAQPRAVFRVTVATRP